MHMLPSPHVRALTGDLPPDTCAACGLHRVYHYDCSGIVLMGCIAAQHRVDEGYLVVNGKMRLEAETCQFCGCYDCSDEYEMACGGKQAAIASIVDDERAWWQ